MTAPESRTFADGGRNLTPPSTTGPAAPGVKVTGERCTRRHPSAADSTVTQASRQFRDPRNGGRRGQ